MNEILKDLDFCFAYLDDNLVFSLSPKSTINASVHSSLNLKNTVSYSTQRSEFPCPRNFIPWVQNHITGFPGSTGTSRRSPSLSSFQDRRKIRLFLGMLNFSDVSSPRSSHSSPSSRRHFRVQSNGFSPSHTEQLQPTPAARHSSTTKCVHRDFQDSTHMFLWEDAIRSDWELPWSDL